MYKWMVSITSAFIIIAAGTVPAATGILENMKGQVLNECQGKFKGKRPTPEELKIVLNDHIVWITRKFDTQEKKFYLRMANLCGAVLPGANLRRVVLSRADLSGADLTNANLSGADLNDANLSGADLHGVNLSRARLSNANFSGAGLSDANLSEARLFLAILSGANLNDANLSGADLTSANLSGADLTGANLSGASPPNANLSGARLHSANLSGVVFQPKELPDLNEISNAKNLWTMIFFDNPQPLVRLRKAFKESGYYQQEREVTCAIERNVTEDLFKKKLGIVSLFEGVFRYVFFDLTCQYGMAPSRALLILISLIPVFAIPYVIALYLPGQNGIWRKWADDRMRVDIGTKEPTHIRVGWLQAFSLGLYFSVLSAFNIGWREFNVGNWIQHLQAKEYTLRATGWVRTFSGVQSLISVYLLAIWVLTYFGRPFN
jgi:uncharacterized protein YjbI with pentapeptide repeats